MSPTATWSWFEIRRPTRPHEHMTSDVFIVNSTRFFAHVYAVIFQLPITRLLQKSKLIKAVCRYFFNGFNSTRGWSGSHAEDRKLLFSEITDQHSGFSDTNYPTPDCLIAVIYARHLSYSPLEDTLEACGFPCLKYFTRLEKIQLFRYASTVFNAIATP